MNSGEWWATILGGGFIARQCTLLGGEPGAGKSSWALMVAQAFANETGKRALYIPTEEAPQEIKERAIRLGLDPASIVIPCEPQDHTLECLDDMREDFSVVILDSLPDLIGNNPNDGIAALDVLKNYSMHNDTPTLIIDHVNKGEELAGLYRLQFKVDTTVYLRNEEGHPERYMTVFKNRFGQSHKTIELLMRGEHDAHPGLLYPKPGSPTNKALSATKVTKTDKKKVLAKSVESLTKPKTSRKSKKMD